LTEVVGSENVKVYFDTEDTYGDGGSAGLPDFSWLGIVQEPAQAMDNNLSECRGIGDIDINSLRPGMVAPDLDIKYIIQKYKAGGCAYGDWDPATFLKYATTFPTGLGLEWLASFGATPTIISLWYKGFLVDSLEIDFTADSFVTASVKLLGQNIAVGTAAVGNSYEDNPLDLANSNCLPLTGFDAEVFMNATGAVDVPLTNVKSVKLSVKNHLARIPVIRSATPTLLKYIQRTKRELTGEIVVFMESSSEYKDLVDMTDLDIRVDLDSTQDRPYFDFSHCTLDKGSIGTRINEFPCDVVLPFKAVSLTIG